MAASSFTGADYVTQKEECKMDFFGIVRLGWQGAHSARRAAGKPLRQGCGAQGGAPALPFPGSGDNQLGHFLPCRIKKLIFLPLFTFIHLYSPLLEWVGTRIISK
jgi:hypothetical protein